MFLSHPQLRARMSRLLTEQHATLMMTAAEGGHTKEVGPARHTSAMPVRRATENKTKDPFSKLHFLSQKWNGVVSACCLPTCSSAAFDFMLENSTGEKKPAQYSAGVICRQASIHKCLTDITVLVMLPLCPSLLLIPVSATPAHIRNRSRCFLQEACQSIEPLMQNHAQSQPRNANSTS